MAFRLVVLCAMLALARAGNIVAPVVAAAPVAKLVQPAVAVPVAKAAIVDNQFDPHPQYNYAYDIQVRIIFTIIS